ncbi:Mitochondrial outer membrane protein iml2 [Orbilia ellipsospora]|uniref:Mitochondrial outer membrane protein iml2 n=1 Tax=Orbilia ellipsospora TaxID=2528407 RepID=A0AAV9X5F0_9PEZI
MEEKPKPASGGSNSFQEEPKKPNPTPVVSQAEFDSTSSRARIVNRVGVFTAVFFFGSFLFVLICMGWFAFLWWGTIENSVWHDIVIHDWAVRAISLPTSFFRIAIVAQTGLCFSMLASLAIEKAIVPLPDVAAISMMRATAPSESNAFLKFILPLARTPPGLRSLETLSVVSLTFLVILTSSILNFTSTILLSDVIVQPIPAKEIQLGVALDYKWTDYRLGADTSAPFYRNWEWFYFSYSPIQDNFYWQTDPPLTFPTIAEYSASSPSVPGLVDTGPTVRAFLPFLRSDDRSRIRSYKGKVPVWDSRVVCQKPKISNFKLSGGDHPTGTLYLTGHVQSTVSADFIIDSQPATVPFFCSYEPAANISICQLPNSCVGQPGVALFGNPPYTLPSANYGGGLKSEFSESDRKSKNGGAYLILNSTDVSATAAELSKNEGWAEIGKVTDDSGDFSREIDIIGTLCYTALDAVDRDVEISRIEQQQEKEFANYSLYTTPYSNNLINASTVIYDFTDTLTQLLPANSSESSKSRGIFDLKPPSSGWPAPLSSTPGSDGPWETLTNLTRPNQVHFLVDALFLRYRPPTNSSSEVDPPQIYGNYTVKLQDRSSVLAESSGSEIYTVSGRNWQGALFAAAKNHPNGNTAYALQSVLTVIASNAYYSNFQQLPRQEPVTAVSFLNVSSPGGPFGTRRGGSYALEQAGLFADYVGGKFPVGFTIVAVVLGCQLILALVVFVRFVRETSLTRIGDPWQSLAQIASEEFEGLDVILKVSKKIKSDREAVSNELTALGADKTCVGLKQEGGSTKLTSRNAGGETEDA